MKGVQISIEYLKYGLKDVVLVAKWSKEKMLLDQLFK